MDVRVEGAVPVSITDVSGAHRVVSLNTLTFNGGVAVPPANWDAKPANVERLTKWLGYLSQLGQLTPLAPTIKFAFGLAAARSGSWGNGMTFKIDKVVAPADPLDDTTVDATVNVASTFSRLTPATLAKRLGEGAVVGTTPGLVIVKGGAAPKMPDAMANPESLFGGANGALQAVDVDGGGDTAFTLEAVGDGGGASTFTLQVTDVDPANETFSLVVAWSKTAPAVALGKIDTTFGYVLKCNPADRFSAVPSEGAFAFAGGADPDPSDITDHGTEASTAVLSS